MMCTNVSMWGPVYWTAENVTKCTREIETIEEEKMEEVGKKEKNYRRIGRIRTVLESKLS